MPIHRPKHGSHLQSPLTFKSRLQEELMTLFGRREVAAPPVATAKVATFQVLASYTAGTTIALSGFGFSPKYAILWWSGRGDTVDARSRATLRCGQSFIAGPTDRVCNMGQSTDSAGTSEAHMATRDDAVAGIISNAGGIAGLLDLQTFDADGMTFIVDQQFAQDVTISFLANGDPGITGVETGNFTESAGLGLQTVSGLSVDPTHVLFIGSGFGGPPPKGPSNTMRNAMGAMKSTTEQGYSAWKSRDAQATSSTHRASRQGDRCWAMIKAGGAISPRLEFDSFGVGSFTINKVEQEGDNILFMAIEGGDFAIGELQTKTDGTDIVVSGLPFEPGPTMFLSAMAAEDADDTSRVDAGNSIGAANGVAEQTAQHFFDRHSLASTQVRTGIEFDDVYLNTDIGANIEGTMRYKSTEVDGFTCFMSNPDPSAAHVMYWVFGK